LKITIPISVGELLDKISILYIKYQYTQNSYVKMELQDLIKIAKENKVYSKKYIKKLLEINQKLWDIEDQLRIFEQKHIFDEEFITLARFVYTYNDTRSEIKKQINKNYNSVYQEVKCYA
jgi:hypothetical protein